MRANALVVFMAADGERVCLRATSAMTQGLVKKASMMQDILFAKRDGNVLILTLRSPAMQPNRFSAIMSELATALNPRNPKVLYEKRWSSAAKFLAAARLLG